MHASKYKFTLCCYCAHLCYYEVRIKTFDYSSISLGPLGFCVTLSYNVGGVEFLEIPVSQHGNKEA